MLKVPDVEHLSMVLTQQKRRSSQWLKSDKHWLR